MFGQNIYSNYFLMKTAHITNRIISLERFFLKILHKEILHINFSNFDNTSANIYQINSKQILLETTFVLLRSTLVRHNVPMLELVAAWEPSFFHQVGAKLGKRNGQFTEKSAMSFSMCCATVYLEHIFSTE